MGNVQEVLGVELSSALRVAFAYPIGFSPVLVSMQDIRGMSEGLFSE